MAREGLILSGLLHLAVILLLILGLPYFFKMEIAPPPPITVELVDSEDLVSSQKPAKEKKPEPAKKTPPKPEEKPAEKPKPQPQKQEEASVQTIEDLVAAEQDIFSLVDDAVIQDLQKPQEPPKPKPKPTKPPAKKPEKKKNEAFDSLLKDVTDVKPKTQPVSHTDGKASDSDEDITKTLSVSELDALRQQIRSCWNVPAGAQDAQDLVIDIHVEIDSQANVRVVQLRGGNRGHPYFKVAADSAARALRNPRCSPLRIPPHRIAELHSFTFRFNPRDMF